MAVTCSGAEFNAFIIDQFNDNDDHWFDDVFCTINGQIDDLNYSFRDEDMIPAEAKVVIEGGEFHVCPRGSKFFSFEQRLSDWLKARNFTVMVIEIENEHVDLQRAAIGQLLGVRIIG